MTSTSNEGVSVIIPLYNGEMHIVETINSVLKQSLPDVEIIVVDDGSSDRGVELIQKISGEVHIINQENLGAATARNRGVKEATKRWIAFLDADDIWHPDKLKEQLAAYGQLEWSYTDTVFTGGVNDSELDSRYTTKHSGNVLEELVKGNFISTSTVLITRHSFLSLGGFDESLRSIEDWELWIRMAAQHKIGYLNKPMTQYRIHGESVSRNARKTLPNHIRVIDKIFEKNGPAFHIRQLKSSAKAQSCGICSYISEEEGDLSFALRCALMAVWHDPTRLSRWTRAMKAFVKWPFNYFRSTHRQVS